METDPVALSVTSFFRWMVAFACVSALCGLQSIRLENEAAAIRCNPRLRAGGASAWGS
jgi:hypothetical protein